MRRGVALVGTVRQFKFLLSHKCKTTEEANSMLFVQPQVLHILEGMAPLTTSLCAGNASAATSFSIPN